MEQQSGSGDKKEKVEDILNEYGDGDSDDEMIDPYKLYNEAYQLMSAGEYLNSFPKFEQAFDLARNLNQMKLFDKAISDFTRDLDSGTLSKPSYCHCFRAMAYSNLNDYENSHKDLNFAIEKEEEGVIKGGYHFHRGLIRNKMKNLEGAVGDFTQAMLLDPEGSSNAIVFRFLVNYKLGNEEAMRKDYFLIKDMGNVPEQFRDDIEKIGERFKFNEEKPSEPKEEEPVETPDEVTDKIDTPTMVDQDTSTPQASTEANVPALNLMGGAGDGDGDPIEVSPEVEAEVNAMSNSEKLRVLKTELNKFENMTKERDEEKIMLYLASDMGRLTKLLDWFNREAKNWKTKFEDGRKLVNGKNYAGAADLLTECLEFEPQHTETYYLRAVSYYHLNDLDKAMSDVVEAIKQDSTNHLFFSLMGYIYVSMGDLERALRVFHQAMERKPNHHEYYYICAMLHDNLKDINSSLEYIDKALELLPNHEPYMQFKLSILMKKQAEVSEAAENEQRKNDLIRQEIKEKMEQKSLEEEKIEMHKQQQQEGEEKLPPRVSSSGDDDDEEVDEELDLESFRKEVEENLEDFDFRKMERLKWEMEKELEKKTRLEKELAEKEELLKQIQEQKHYIQQKVEEDEAEDLRLDELERKEVEKMMMLEKAQQQQQQVEKKKSPKRAPPKEQYDDDDDDIMEEEDEEEEEVESSDDEDDQEEEDVDEEDILQAEEEFEQMMLAELAKQEGRKGKSKKKKKKKKTKKMMKKKMTKKVEAKSKEENALTTILRDGDRQIFHILKALRLGQYFQNFRDKNVIWFDVVHGYLNEEDYAEVFPRVRFMRRFKTYVEKYVLKEKKNEDIEVEEEEEEEYY